MTLAKKMAAYFLLVILVSAAGFIYTIYQCDYSAAIVDNLKGYEVPRLERTTDLAYNAMAQSSNVRAYLLYGNEQYLIEFKRLVTANMDLEDEMIKESRTEEARRLISEIKDMDDLYAKLINEKVVPLVNAGKKEEAMQVVVDEAVPVANRLIAKVNEAKNYRKSVIQQATDQSAKATKQAEIASASAAVLVAIVGLLIALLAARKITSPVKELLSLMARASQGDLRVKVSVSSSDEIGQLCESFNIMISEQVKIIHSIQNAAVELAAASEEMAASSQEVASASNVIANECQLVAQAMEEASGSSSETSQVLIELSSLIQIAKDKAASASGKSEATKAAAWDGKETVTEAMQSMNTIYGKTKEAERVITNLSEYSQQIGMINETITGIAKQTNLLALNAAIEAARAGEAGRGFAVVAEEVRKLAEQSNKEASNINQLIEKITENNSSAVTAMNHSLTEVEIGVQAVKKAEASLENILTAIEDTVHDIAGIAKVTDEEVASSDKIVNLIEVVAEDIEKTEQDVQAVSAATEETSATIETIAASSEQTSAMAQNLQNLIRRFQI